MTDKDRYDKYIKEHCVNCKNKDTMLCEIRIMDYNDIITTKCVYYENEHPREFRKSIAVWE